MNKIDNLRGILSLYDKIETDYEFNIDENLKILKQIYGILGEELEEYDEEKIDIHKFFIEKIAQITQKILDSLDDKGKEIFLNNIPQIVKICILNDDEKIKAVNEVGDELFSYDIELITKTIKCTDDEKIEQLDNINVNEFAITIICSLQSDEKKLKVLEKFWLEDKFVSKTDILKIIKTIKDDENKIKSLKYIDSEDKIEVTMIICSLQSDDEKIKQLENIKDELNRISIICSLQDDDKKIKCLEDIEDEGLKTRIILTIEDDKKKIQQLEGILNEEYRIDIIRSLKDDLIKIQCLDKIENQTQRYNIIKTFNDDKNKVQALDYLDDELYKTRIIISLENDDEKLKALETIRSEETRIEIIKSFENDDIKINFLESISDESYRVEIVKSLQDDDKKIAQLVNISYEQYRIEIVISLESDEKKIKFLENITDEKDRLKIIETLSIDGRIEALDYLQDEENKFKIISRISDSKKRLKALGKINENYAKVYELIYSSEGEEIEHKYESLNLPSNMTIGIEIESEGENNKFLPENLFGWEGKNDYSIGNNGIEYASTIMHDEPNDVKRIYRVNEILRTMGMEITPRCGGHVHIGADYITREEGFKQLVELWGNAEEIYYLISNKPGELPRKGIEKYAKPISDELGEAELEKIPKDRFISVAKGIFQRSRYKSLNLMGVNNERNTIEFRLANGTLDGDTWIENIRLFGRTVEVAEELGQIVSKLEAGEELTEEEKTKYALKEMLKGDIPQDAKMDILMKILFTEEERKVYYERYSANKKLNREAQSLKDFSFGKVDFKKVYDGVEIPEDIINKLQEGKTEELDQR